MIVPSGTYTEVKEMLLEVCSGKLRPLTGLDYSKNLPHLKISGKYLIVYLVRAKMLKSVPYKILVTLFLCNSFDDHMLSNGILTDRQWRFRRGYSTESLLPHLTESWVSALDRGQKVGVLFIEL